MGSAFLCAEFGYDNQTHENTAAYVANWIRALESDERIFVAACSAASKAVEFCRERAIAEDVEHHSATA